MIEKTLFNDGLEIGAGTGQATDLFINSIKTLDIVEVGDKQIEYLLEKYKGENVNTYKSYFEKFESNKKYDLIFSATAFHWVDENVGYPKAWDMLKDGESFAVFWHMSSVTLHDTGIIQSGNYFGIPVIKEYRWIDTPCHVDKFTRQQGER